VKFKVFSLLLSLDSIRQSIRYICRSKQRPTIWLTIYLQIW